MSDRTRLLTRHREPHAPTDLQQQLQQATALLCNYQKVLPGDRRGTPVPTQWHLLGVAYPPLIPAGNSLTVIDASQGEGAQDLAAEAEAGTTDQPEPAAVREDQLNLGEGQHQLITLRALKEKG